MNRTRHGTSNPGQPGRQHTTPRLHPAYQKARDPEAAKAHMRLWFAKQAAKAAARGEQ